MTKHISIELNIDPTFFPRILKTKRIESGLSLQAFASQLGCSVKELEQAENSEACLSEEVVDRFLNDFKLYNLSKLYLMASSQGFGISKAKHVVGPRVFKQVQELFLKEEFVVLDK
jgi:transcriptional regulator with XRE-family HTH domain